MKLSNEQICKIRKAERKCTVARDAHARMTTADRRVEEAAEKVKLAQEKLDMARLRRDAAVLNWNVRESSACDATQEARASCVDRLDGPSEHKWRLWDEILEEIKPDFRTGSE